MTDQWEKLMERARKQATLSGQKSKIVASLVSSRTENLTGSKYQYTLLIPEREWDFRCGEAYPKGMPCIKRVGFGHGLYHLSRIASSDKFVFWTYTDCYGRPTRKMDYSIEARFASPLEVEEMGLL